MGMYIGLDLAYNTGVAIGRPGERPALSTLNLRIRKQREGEVFYNSLCELRNTFEEFEPVEVFVEAPIHGKKADKIATREFLIGLRAIAYAAAFSSGSGVCQFQVSTIRKHFIGIGNLPRAEAKRAVMVRCKQLGWIADDDNQADAAAVWDYGCSLRNWEHSVGSLPIFKGGVQQ